jgi:hypothetical protein
LEVFLLKKFIALVSVCFVLVGCGSSDVDAIRDSKMIVDSSITVSQALENRDVCSSYSWSSYEDEKGRAMVEYGCQIKGAEDYFLSSKESVDSYLMGILGRKINKGEEYVEELEASLAEASASINEILENYKKENRLGDFIFGNYNISAYSSCGVSTSNYSEESAKALEACLYEKISGSEDNINYRKSKIEEYKADVANKSKASHVISASEKFMWIVLEDELHYLYGGIELEFDSGEKLDFDYMSKGGRFGYSMERALKDTIKNSHNSYSQLASSRDGVPGIKEVISRL